jgi:hypothetical protein
MRRVLCAAVATLVVACLVGCGGGADYATPKDTFTTMWNAAKAGKEDAMVACFIKEFRDKWPELRTLTHEMIKIMGADAEEMDMMKMFQDQAKKTPAPVYGAEKIDGSKATLEVTLEVTHVKTKVDADGKETKSEEKKKETETIDFVKESDGWKMSPPGGKIPDVEEMKKSLEAMKAMKALTGKTDKE